MITISNLFQAQVVKDFEKEVHGQEEVCIIFNCDSGNIQNTLAIGNLIRKIPHTTAIVEKAISAPFFLSVLCENRYVERGAILQAHTGCLFVEEIALEEDRIPKKAFDDITEYKSQLFSRLKEVGVDTEAMSFLKYTGWLKRGLNWWVDKGIFLPIECRD